jgi:hypothetical protein
MINPQRQEVKSQIEIDILNAGEKFITGRAGSRFCRISIIVAAVYVYGYLLWQAVHYGLGVAR